MNQPSEHVVTESKDKHGYKLVVGDCIRNIESNWHGKIKRMYRDGNPTDGYQDILVCTGINYWTGEIDHDDIQYHVAFDTKWWPRSVSGGDPINAINLM